MKNKLRFAMKEYVTACIAYSHLNVPRAFTTIFLV